ncbi:Rid family hydrolase [Henriciella aquimarina]|uniref:Rid family hydrolase n=1 Tax=Henriciella aquimarina TaxID=545261 RepID=UPI000A021FB5|nr:Rid family hydrolase [Henriciella aquimarina]
MRCTLQKLAATLCSGLLVAQGANAQDYAYSLIRNGENVGHLKIDQDDRTETVEYYVDSNGRGPKHDERIILDEADIPVEWQIEGTSLMGSPVEEVFHLEDGVATWKSQADSGEKVVSEPALYAVNDGSPWANYVYARAMLENDRTAMPVLPAGTLSLAQADETELSVGGETVSLDIYRLSGIDLGPSLIALDAEGAFFAGFSESSAMVREGYEALAGDLMELARDLKVAWAEELAGTIRHTFDGPWAIANVRILDPVAGELGEPSTVVIEDNRIARIEAWLPAADYPDGMTVYDGAGGTLMPGLWDVHSHASLSSGLYYIAAGVTSTRDMGNDNDFLTGLMEKLETGQLVGPRITPAGFIEGRSPYSARHGIIAASEEEAVDAVDWYAARDYPFIKIYNSMNPDWIPAMADRAKAHGMRVIGHVPAFTNANEMIRAGYDEITHLNQLMLGWLLDPDEDTRTPLRLTGMQRAAELDLASDKVSETIGLMQAHEVGTDPTAVILERLMLSRAGKVQEGDKPYLSHMPIGYQRYRKRSFVTLEDDATDQAYVEAFERVLETLKLLHDSSIQLLPGTDDGTGFTVHRELELYEKAGIPTADVLRLGTLGPARYLGYGEDRGTLEAGKLADFILIGGNPLENLSAIRKPRLVAKDGDVYLPAEIYAALSIEPFATPPAVLDASDAPETAEPIRYEGRPDSAVEHFPMLMDGEPVDADTLPFSAAVRVGDVLYLSGQIGRGGESFEADARQAMDSIKALVTRADADMSDIFKCTVMIDDMDQWPAFNTVYKTYFKAGKMPARSAFGADGLALGAPLEVECMAHAPGTAKAASARAGWGTWLLGGLVVILAGALGFALGRRPRRA